VHLEKYGVEKYVPFVPTRCVATSGCNFAILI